MDDKDTIKDQVSLVRMLRSSATLRARMLNMGLQWFSVTLCYYGLSFASTKLSQNVFTDFMLRYNGKLDLQSIGTSLKLNEQMICAARNSKRYRLWITFSLIISLFSLST